MVTASIWMLRRLFRKAVQQGRSERRGESYSVPYVEPLSDARTLLAVFVNSLLIKTGNISAQAVCALPERNLSAIERVLQTHTLIEIDHSTVKPVL